MIRALPEDVRCRLRSGIAITSVSQCVEELILNSADAQATCIAVRVDLEIFKVQVVDNGCGLGPEDMERVGMRYFTSKCHSLKDLEDLRYYGFRGEAIASMADVCSIVEISSKHKLAGKTLTKLFQNRKPLSVQQAELTRPSVGTTVTLFNLFYNLPVRRGCVDPILELEKIRQKVEAASLMKVDISFSLKNDALHSMVLQLPKTRDVCSRFCQIYGPVKSQHLREIRHTQDRLTIVGYISCEGHYNKTMQFLYVNSRLVLKTRLHKLIDFVLRKKSVICRPKASQAGHTSGSAGFHRTSSDLHGIYVLNIQCSYEEYDICFEPHKTLIEFQDWSCVLQFVEQTLNNFLKNENLYSEPSKEEVTEFNQKHHLNLSCHELSPEGRSPTSICKLVINNLDPASLRSKPVCRRKVTSPHVVDDDKMDINTANNTENISLASSPSPMVTTKGLDCLNLNSAVPCGTGGLNLVTEREDDMQQNDDVTDGSSRLDSCNKEYQELVTSSSSLVHHPRPCTPSIIGLNAEDLNRSKLSVWCIQSSEGDPDPPMPVTNRPLDSEHSAVWEKKSNITHSYCADRLSVFSGRTRALPTDRAISGMPIYEMATLPPEPSKKAKPLKLHLPLRLDSLDKFKRSYRKKDDALGLQLPCGTEPAGAEISYASGDQLLPALPETTLHAKGAKMLLDSTLEGAKMLLDSCFKEKQNMMLESPLTSSYSILKKKESGTAQPHSSLSNKLCRLKRDMELASYPLEIQSGELHLKKNTERSMADPPPSTSPSNDIQAQENVNIDVGSLDWQPENDEPKSKPPQIRILQEETEAESLCPEWLQHYEQTLGRNVFINTSTGLSTYSGPQADNTTECTKDLSTMSVRVVCNNGTYHSCVGACPRGDHTLPSHYIYSHFGCGLKLTHLSRMQPSSCC